MDSSDETEEKEVYIQIASGDSKYLPDVDTTCVICHAEFLDSYDLIIHLNQVHEITSSVLKKCQLCPKAYTDMMDYAEHIRDYHLLSLRSCSLCWRVFDDFDVHRSHRKKHVVEKFENTYNCSQCKQKYTDLFSLKNHEYSHKESKEGILLHDVFPYLSAALKVKSITFIETLGTDVVYICVGCNFSTVDMSMYLRHVRSNQCEVCVCHTCGNVFKQKKQLVKHLRHMCNIFGVRETKTHFCPDCNTYITVSRYTKHKSHCKPIKCYTCNITFTSINDWSDHQSKEHSSQSIAVETCPLCWKRFVGKTAMQKHIDKTHKPDFHLFKYLCIYCKSLFNHPQKLFGHFLTRHKDIFPYTCKICDKTFRIRKKFTIHIKLEHKSVGFVEFDKNYHVFFTEKKSENPFIPVSPYINDTDVGMLTSNDDKNNENTELNSNFMHISETDGDQTESYVKETSRVRGKKTSKIRKQDVEEFNTIQSSDDEPLLAVRKRVRLQKKNILPLKKRRTTVSNRTSLTCNICDKFCYTVQNYNHHVSLHSKHEVKKCIKCSRMFKSKAKLNEHIASDHSSSRLTETLKTLLEKRKTGGSLTEDLPTSVKFQRTLVKVNAENVSSSAKITLVDQKLSVQTFFENFIPEENKTEPQLNTTATIKLVTGYAREPAIKMIKFKSTPISTSQKLAMPVKFVDHYHEHVKVSIKLVEAPCQIDQVTDYHSDHSEEHYDTETYETIPEVAEEVMLENTEEVPKQQQEVSQKIIIPKLPTELTNIRIAHLLPEAPFYKIVKVKDVLDQPNVSKDDGKKHSPIKLPDGTKLVSTNPLAHLLGNKQEAVLQSVKNKHYKPKNQNFQGLLAKALTMLEKPVLPRKRKKGSNTEVFEEIEEK